MLKSERTRLFLEVGRLVAGSEAVEAVVVLLLEHMIERLLIVGVMTGVEGEGGDEIDTVSRSFYLPSFRIYFYGSSASSLVFMVKNYVVE